MKWIVGYTKVVGVNATRVDYCPKGDPVLSAQNNKINQSSLLYTGWTVEFIYMFLFSSVEKNEVLLIFNIFIYLFI